MMYTLEIDKRIYPLGIIQKAVDDYLSIAIILINSKSNSNQVILEFQNFTINFLELKDEFCNYLIELIAINKGEL